MNSKWQLEYSQRATFYYENVVIKTERQFNYIYSHVKSRKLKVPNEDP